MMLLCRFHESSEGKGLKISKPPARHWTSDEEAELDRLLAADKEAAEIAVALNRTRQAVYVRGCSGSIENKQGCLFCRERD
jgi:hypothetical protein